MAYYKKVWLTCDGEDCNRAYGENTFLPTATRAREHAQEYGWVYRNGEDYCYECK